MYEEPISSIQKFDRKISECQDWLQETRTKAEDHIACCKDTRLSHFIDDQVMKLYNLPKTCEYTDRVAHGVVIGNVLGRHSLTTAEDIAHLDNHNAVRVLLTGFVLVASGRETLARGAERWLESMTGPGLTFSITPEASSHQSTGAIFVALSAMTRHKPCMNDCTLGLCIL